VLVRPSPPYFDLHFLGRGIAIHISVDIAGVAGATRNVRRARGFAPLLFRPVLPVTDVWPIATWARVKPLHAVSFLENEALGSLVPCRNSGQLGLSPPFPERDTATPSRYLLTLHYSRPNRKLGRPNRIFTAPPLSRQSPGTLNFTASSLQVCWAAAAGGLQWPHRPPHKESRRAYRSARLLPARLARL
jgi:hypothetical protein